MPAQNLFLQGMQTSAQVLQGWHRWLGPATDTAVHTLDAVTAGGRDLQSRAGQQMVAVRWEHLAVAQAFTDAQALALTLTLLLQTCNGGLSRSFVHSMQF